MAEFIAQYFQTCQCKVTADDVQKAQAQMAAFIAGNDGMTLHSIKPLPALMESKPVPVPPPSGPSDPNPQPKVAQA